MLQMYRQLDRVLEDLILVVFVLPVTTRSETEVLLFQWWCWQQKLCIEFSD